MTKRIAWLDIAKGIGIILVVVGHCLNINSKAFHLIFVFHMPLFFVLSGYVYSEQEIFPVLLEKKAKSLLLPFVRFFLLGLIVTLIVPQWRSGLTFQGLWQDIWLADPNAVHNSSIWFLVCLFFVAVLFYWIEQLPVWLRFITLLGLYALGIRYSGIRTEFVGLNRLPMNLDVVPVAIVFYSLGYYAKRCGAMETVTKSWQRELTAAIIGTVGIIVVYRRNGYVNLHGLRFGDSNLYLLGGLFGTLATVAASALISRAEKGIGNTGKQLLIWYGRHSLAILGVQSLLIRLYIVAVQQFFGISLGLYQFSMKHAIVSSVLITIFACPMVCLLTELLSATVKKRDSFRQLLRTTGTLMLAGVLFCISIYGVYKLRHLFW